MPNLKKTISFGGRSGLSVRVEQGPLAPVGVDVDLADPSARGPDVIRLGVEWRVESGEFFRALALVARPDEAGGAREFVKKQLADSPVESARVRQLVADGTLPAQKFGPVNMVKESDLDLVRNRPGVGRPPKPKAEETPDALNRAFRAATESAGPRKAPTGQKRAGNGHSGGRKGGKK